MEMWGVYDIDELDQAPMALFLSENEANGYILLASGGCMEMAAIKCSVDVTVSDDGIVTKG